MKLPSLRSRLRFSLRSLLAAVTAVALLLGWHMYRVARERQAVQMVLKLGGTMLFDYQQRPSTDSSNSFDPKAVPRGPQWLRDWLGPEHFDSVVLVSLRDKPISAEHLRELVKFTKLHSLDLTQTPIRDDDLQELTPLTNLKILELSLTAVSSAGIKHIAPLKKLEWLTLYKTPVDDEALPYIAGLHNLRNLMLDGTRITDAGTKHLAGLTQMDGWLGLRDTAITDASLPHFQQLKKLQQLNLIETRVTPAGVRRLRESLPHTQISLHP